MILFVEERVCKFAQYFVQSKVAMPVKRFNLKILFSARRMNQLNARNINSGSMKQRHVLTKTLFKMLTEKI